MEADFVLIDRGVVHSTKRRRRQFFLGVFSGLSSTVFSFFIKTTYSREPWHCGVQREERIVHAFAWFRNCIHQNNAPCLIILFNKKYGRQRKLNYRYTSIPSVFSLAKKVELIAKTPELWSRHRSVMCGVFSLGTITWCGLRRTTTILDN